MTLNTTPGDPNADSYASLDDASTYFTNLGIATWASQDGVLMTQEEALRRAASYLDTQYNMRWRGLKSNETQALAWPRGDAMRELWRVSWLLPLLDQDGFPIDTQSIPMPVKYAQMEAALLILCGTDLQPTLIRGGLVQSQISQVGPLRKETVWSPGAPGMDRYLKIEGLLRGLTTSSPGAPDGIVTIVRG